MTGESPANSRQSLSEQADGKAFHALATHFAFARREDILRRRMRILNFVGLGPLLVAGAVALTFNRDESVWSYTASVAAIASVLQAVMCGISICFEWPSELSRSTQASVSNLRIFDEFRAIASERHEQLEVVERRLAAASAVDLRQQELDSGGLSDEELRRGYRKALWFLEKTCPTCGSTVKGMQPSQCETCGGFKERRWAL